MRQTPEYFDPMLDSVQRSRTKIRGLKVEPRRPEPKNPQEPEQHPHIGTQSTAPRFVRQLSRPSTPIRQPKKDQREEIEMIKKHFDLPKPF
jgi:hypothetical protein